MLPQNRAFARRALPCLMFASTLPLLCTPAAAQAAPGTAPIPSQSSSQSSSQGTTTPGADGQTGTTAAPGTAPIRSRATAQQITPQRVTTYDEKFTLFGGLLYANGQAGQNLPKHYNMGGGEVMGTYWLKPRLGVAGDYRLQAGTSPILPTGAQFGLNRVTVRQSIVSGGVEFRGPRNRYAALSLHGLAGATRGTFDSAITGYPANATPRPTTAYVGLYDNHTSAWGAAGGSIDLNQTPKLAVRLSPEIVFEHFGTETREFVSVSGGVIYRFGKRR